ncbi:hypothetical protein [Parabacteroides goldsteinii]|uniref:hypothetical protein n=1 Tax=Parabacteroides goldsteinii TaxID=328812 RepID=UPI0025B2273F|nr:hypothetical protein [Parabacteroides goldsteinii]
MKIYVRNNDGLVLNSYQFNGSFPDGINNETMYAGEDYTVHNITNVPDDPERAYFFKKYYFKNGVFDLEYVLEVRQIEYEIDRLKSELSNSDYKIIKSYEMNMLGLPIEYDIEKIHFDRQVIRNKINELLKLIENETSKNQF